MRISFLTIAIISLFVAGCQVKETHNTIQPITTNAPSASYSGPKYKLAIGTFENKSTYMNGIFSDGNDSLGIQARQILKTHLSQSSRFTVLDRANMQALAREAKFQNKELKTMGSDVVVTGAVTEFGRGDIGNKALGGLISKSKSQKAYCKVSISVVNVSTSAVLCSVQGAGEYQLTNKEVMGFGSTAGYDSSLTDKVLNLAMIEAVNRLVEGIENKNWSLE